MKRLSTGKGVTALAKGLAMLAVVFTVFGMMTVDVLAAQGTVTATVKIRKEASTDSEVVGSVTSGKTIDILEAVKDSAGTVWYRVSIAGGNYGYIRGDYVETSETITVSESGSTSASSSTASKPEETVPTSIGERAAVIHSDRNVNVRSGASTQHDQVASLPDGTAVTLIGEANDSSGNKWYQITCSYNGRTVEGYVRSDLLSEEEVSDGNAQAAEGEEGAAEGTEAENPEETPQEETENTAQEEPVEEHNDYEIAYVQSETGESDYVLYDYTTNTQIPISRLKSLLAEVSTVEEAVQLKEQVQNEKIIIIILAIVIVLLFIVLSVLLFKLRDAYYYEEEEEEEEEAEPEPPKKKKPQIREKEEKELYAAEVKEPAKKPAVRKPQNFLIDDDEFEFEFLNMDDKDL